MDWHLRDVRLNLKVKGLRMPNTIYKNYQQCKRCVMDTSDIEIVFDDKGYCNHCSDFLENKLKLTYQGIESDLLFQKSIEKIKLAGRGKKYDCIVGVSGGADSCYLAMECKKAGLRTLLVHMDNGWDSETSVKNIETIVNYCGFDYESYVLDWREFKEIQLSHFRASVPEIETPTDIAILEYLHKSAAKHNVKYIVMGGNYFTEGILPVSWHYNAKDKKYSKSIHKTYSNLKPKNFPSFDFAHESYYKYIKGIKIYYLLNQVAYSKQIASQELEKIGWKNYGQKHHESFYTRLVQSYILPTKFNIDYRLPILSTKICTGQMSREEALIQLKEKPYNEETLRLDIEYICKKLEITQEEFEIILNQKPKTFRDYPNNKWLLDRFYKLYRTTQTKNNFKITELEKQFINEQTKGDIQFSIIIPTYNRANFILKTIESVLNQTYSNFEIIIVDDGSIDNTEQTIASIEDKRIKYFKTINQERGAARNFGIQKSIGDYLVFLDSDDLMYKYCLELASKFIHDKASLPVFHIAHEIRESDFELIENTIGIKNNNQELISGNALACMNVFIKLEVAKQNLFNEDRAMAGFEDWELWLRLAAQYKIEDIGIISGLMINHGGRSSNNHTDNKKLVRGINLLMNSVLNNKLVTNYYQGKLNLFVSSCNTYISLHLALAKKYRMESLKYLIKGIYFNPLFIFKRRFFAILKYII